MYFKKSAWLLAILLPAWGAQAADIELSIDRKAVNISGKAAQAVAINDMIPGTTLHIKEGEEARIRVTNHLNEDTSLHWHGIILPSTMDGVPGLSYDGIKPGESFTYRFTPHQSGTYWYHSHSGFQEQQGAFGALIIDPATPDGITYDRDYTIMLSDWTDENPDDVLKHLKSQSDYYKNPKRDLVSFFKQLASANEAERQQLWSERTGFARMRMDPTDISDVSGYTFLVNGHSPKSNWSGLFKPGERVRLRFINASAATYFDVNIPGLKMQVIAADGQRVEPVMVDQFPIAIAETYDVIVETPADIDQQAYTIFAQAMDRSGYARGTLATQEGAEASVPPMNAREIMNMAKAMPGHHQMKMNHSKNQSMPMKMHKQQMPNSDTGEVKLSYRDLKSIEPTAGKVDRDVTIHLTGNMNRYFWSFDNVKYAMAEPIDFSFGERVRVHLVNETMMHHPIHLHGLWQILQNGQGDYAPRQHTIDIPPKQTVTVEIPVDNRGRWAFHCHVLYHMATGMMREVRVN